MNIAVWDIKYSARNSFVDQSHRQLFGCYNRLADLLVGDCDPFGLRYELDNILLFAIMQHPKEEALIRYLKFPGSSRHEELHDRFLSRVKGIYSRLSLSGSEYRRKMLCAETIDLLTEWIQTHIEIEDHEYVEYFWRHGLFTQDVLTDGWLN